MDPTVTAFVQDMETLDDPDITRQRGFKNATSHKVLKKDFVLASTEEGTVAREKSMQAARESVLKKKN